MNPYSHLVIAAHFEERFQPSSRAEYYWGAIAPDARYPAGLPREQTHLPPAQIRAAMVQHPQLGSFLQGYLVHCQADRVRVEEVFGRHVPFSWLKARFSRQQLTVLLELYLFEHEKIAPPISGSGNAFLQQLGLDEAVCVRFAGAIDGALASPSPRDFLPELVHALGLENHAQMETYLTALDKFERRKLLKKMLFFCIRAAKIRQHITAIVAALLEKDEMEAP